MNGKIAETEECDECSCETRHLLVRGDIVSFVTPERVQQSGPHPLDDRKMPSDITIPKGYVLVHDTTGVMLDRCDLYIVKWHQGGRRSTPKRHQGGRRLTPNLADVVGPDALADAHAYFGEQGGLTVGRIDIPEGPWHRVAQVKFIRYRRVGVHSGSYEHEYEIPVDLMYCTRPLAWRLPLPTGCIVDPRGFVWP